MGLYALDRPYSLATWYEQNGAYDLWSGTDLLLDLTRYILDSDAYIFRGVGFPKGEDVNIAEGQTFSGTLNLIPYSYVLSVTGWSANDNQFTVRIYDKGAQTDVYARQFGWFPSVISNMTGQSNNGEVILNNDIDNPFGPYFFRDPLIILPPGVLQIQITNVATSPSLQRLGICQMFFNVAVPKNTVAMSNRALVTATDPTGTQTLQGAINLLT